MANHGRKVLFLVGFTLVTCTAVAAEERPALDGNGLLSQCTEAMAAVDEGRAVTMQGAHCVGYLQGVRDMALVAQVSYEKQPLWCAPKGVTTEQMLRVVVKFLKGHPEDLHRTAGVQVLVALQEAFPCPVR